MVQAQILYDYELEDKMRTAALGVLPMYGHLLESNPNASHEDIRYTIVRHIQEFGVTGVPHELLTSPASIDNLPEIAESNEQIVEDFMKKEEVEISLIDDDFELQEVEIESKEPLIDHFAYDLDDTEEKSDNSNDNLVAFEPAENEIIKINKERHNIKQILDQF